MGNFPATFWTWVLGSFGAFGIARTASEKTDEESGLRETDTGKFMLYFFVSLIVTFIAGILAFFT